MTHITIQLSPKEVKALKLRTSKRSADAALKAWIASADPAHTSERIFTQRVPRTPSTQADQQFDSFYRASSIINPVLKQVCSPEHFDSAQ